MCTLAGYSPWKLPPEIVSPLFEKTIFKMIKIISNRLLAKSPLTRNSGTSNKGPSEKTKQRSIYKGHTSKSQISFSIKHFELWKSGQPLYKGQNGWPQRVLYQRFHCTISYRVICGTVNLCCQYTPDKVYSVMYYTMDLWHTPHTVRILDTWTIFMTF